MLNDWINLTDDTRLAVSAAALSRAADKIAEQAEVLAHEMEMGALVDLGGPNALRLFAAVVRFHASETTGPVGHA